MKKYLSKILVCGLAMTMAVGLATPAMGKTTTVKSGLTGSGVSGLDPLAHSYMIHYSDNSELPGYEQNTKAEINANLEYFKRFEGIFGPVNIDYPFPRIGVINLKVGESVNLHAPQNNHAYRNEVENYKPDKIYLDDDDGLVKITPKDIIENTTESFCRPFTFTGQNEGTLFILYQSGAIGTGYVKLVVGSGKAAPGEKSKTNDTASTEKAEKAENGATKKEESTAKTAERPARATSSGDLSHTVQLGDTFGRLALNYFGDMNYWTAIYTYNEEALAAAPNGQLYEDMNLQIPSAIVHEGKTVGRIPGASASGNETLYTVKAGDTYGSIAAAELGDTSRYEEIFNRNSDRLRDVKTLFEGQIIVLPAK